MEMKVDFLIVGGGLAGVSFASQCLKNNSTFLLIDNDKNKSSRVAAGVYNPVVLKRLNPAWHAKIQMQFWDEHYKNIRKYTNKDFDYPIGVFRRLYNVEEQNNWFHASDDPKLSEFLLTPLHEKSYHGIDSPYGFGRVSSSGYIDINSLLDDFFAFLKSQQLYLLEEFDYEDLYETSTDVVYKNISASHVVFAEGFGLKNNPWFNQLPMAGSKGETLTVEIKGLVLPGIVKAGVFILPQGNDKFRVGATYNGDDLSYDTTIEGRNILENELKQFLKLPYKVVEQNAGIRPTTADRKPFVGTHPKHKRYHILNGLGTRGVMLGPYAADQLYKNLRYGTEIHPEADIQRFKKWIRKISI